jgi:uncharacterized protein YndB with AHSA1/START domain
MPTGLRQDGVWEIGVSRTLPVAMDDAWSFLVSERGLATWLGPGVRLPDQPTELFTSADGGSGELRSFHPLDRVRVQWQPAGADHTTVVQCTVSGRPGGTTVRFHEEHLIDEVEREQQRAHWRAVMDEVEAALG